MPKLRQGVHGRCNMLGLSMGIDAHCQIDRTVPHQFLGDLRMHPRLS
ncbi:MAG: hypothetical protein ACYSN8_05575 [Planctomycetota bacterium]